MEAEIRKAVPTDAEAWARIRKECWLDVYPNVEYGITREDILLKDFDSPEKLQMWRDSFIVPRDNAVYYSAIIDNKVVGMCITYPDHENGSEVGALYVDLDHHRQGIGRSLMENALASFDPKKKVILKVVSYNDNAINFYKKFGFKIIGPWHDEHDGKLPNGKQLPETLMEKNIN